MVRNFRYVEEDSIALSGPPETPGDVDWLYEHGIKAVLSLHPVSDDVASRMRERGIAWRPFYVADFAKGVPGGLQGALEFVRFGAEEDPAVLIHCGGGTGRAGTLYAAYLIYQGAPVEKALARVPFVEKETQRAFLHGFAAGHSG